MNLEEFLAYRECCPVCTSRLVTCFHSEKKQSIRFEDNRLLITFPLNALKKHQIDYKVGYSFGLTDNSWYVEFYNKDNVRFEIDSPQFLRDRFKELDSNLGSYKFYRHCAACRRYNYSTNSFALNYEKGVINKLCMNMEYIGLSIPFDKGFKIYKLLNDYMSNKTKLLYGKSADEEPTTYDASNSTKFMELLEMNSVVKLSSSQEVAERIDKLIVFS